MAVEGGVIYFVHAAGEHKGVVSSKVSVKDPFLDVGFKAVGLGRPKTATVPPRTPTGATPHQNIPQSQQCLWDQLLHYFFFWQESAPNGNPVR